MLLFSDGAMHVKLALSFHISPIVSGEKREGRVAMQRLYRAHQKSHCLEKDHLIVLLPKSVFNRGKTFGKLGQP